jgi:hypothetical protein
MHREMKNPTIHPQDRRDVCSVLNTCIYIPTELGKSTVSGRPSVLGVDVTRQREWIGLVSNLEWKAAASGCLQMHACHCTRRLGFGGRGTVSLVKVQYTEEQSSEKGQVERATSIIA